MIIVYGTRSGESETRLTTPCNNCRQPALVQSDWYQYFHLMFIPTFPVGKQRSIHCQACGNSFEAKGSAPIWTFAGTMIFVLCLLGGAAQQALRHFGHEVSAASIAAAATDPEPSATASAPAAASASAPPRAAAPRPAATGAASHAAATSSHGKAPASPASAARPRKN